MTSYCVLALVAIFAVVSIPVYARRLSDNWSDDEDMEAIRPERYPDYYYDISNYYALGKRGGGGYFEPLIPKRKRDDETPMRLCGMKLVAAAVEICQGCIKPAGMTLVGKRANGGYITQKTRRSEQQLTDMCCKNMCSRAQIKSDFCC